MADSRKTQLIVCLPGIFGSNRWDFPKNAIGRIWHLFTSHWVVYL